MLKNKKIVYILIFVILFLLFFFLILGKKNGNNIEKKLIKNGFVVAEYSDNKMYIKTISDISIEDFYKNVDNNIESEYSSLKYDLSTNNISGRYITYIDGVISYLNSEYSYENDKYSYDYESIYNDASFSLNGVLDNDNFSCNVVSNVSNDNKEMLCEYIKSKMNDFKYNVHSEIINKNIVSSALHENRKNSTFRIVSFIIFVVISFATYIIYRKVNNNDL